MVSSNSGLNIMNSNIANSSDSESEQLNLSIVSNLTQNFVLELPPNLLLQMMASYSLKASEVAGDYSFNAALCHQLLKKSINQEQLDENNSNKISKELLDIFVNWPKYLNWAQFNNQLNNALLIWLEDYKSGTSLDIIFVLTRCIKLQQSVSSKTLLVDNNLSSATKFQQFFMHLFAKITNQFDQYKFNYAQNYDLETGLPNQQMMLNLLHQRLEMAHDKKHLGLILINLNINFDEESQLNATLSDLMLAAIQSIQPHLNDKTKLFRAGPIELAVLIEKLNFPTQLNLIASKLVHAFELALPMENITLILKPYLGCVSSFNTKLNANALYDSAKLALHHAMIKNYQVEIYDPHIAASFSSIHQLDEAIIDALQQNELEICLQPIVNLSDETCTSAEVLLRWESEQWQGISAVRLVDTIYKKGFGKIFIRWLINTACQKSAQLLSEHQRHISLTINLSANDLLDADLPELLAQAITLWEVPANRLIIEITESDILVDEVKSTEVIDQIVLLGCKLALDDFGTGYSSMARLKSMPINLVKIDQSFVRNIAHSKQDREIVQSVIKLARSLDKEVVAEGVEDLACLDILKQMKCEKIQGYYYAKPMKFDAFTAWLNTFELSRKILPVKKA